MKFNRLTCNCLVWSRQTSMNTTLQQTRFHDDLSQRHTLYGKATLSFIHTHMSYTLTGDTSIHSCIHTLGTLTMYTWEYTWECKVSKSIWSGGVVCQCPCHAKNGSTFHYRLDTAWAPHESLIGMFADITLRRVTPLAVLGRHKHCRGKIRRSVCAIPSHRSLEHSADFGAWL